MSFPSEPSGSFFARTCAGKETGSSKKGRFQWPTECHLIRGKTIPSHFLKSETHRLKHLRILSFQMFICCLLTVKQGDSLLCAIAAMSIKCTVISLSHVHTDIISFKAGFDERKCKQNYLKDKYTNIQMIYLLSI